MTDPTSAASPPYADLDAATLAVRDLIGASRELVGRMAQLLELNPNDMSAIGALTLNGPMGVVELAGHLGIRSSSATVMVDRLERAGKVQRLRDAADRRRVTVRETPAARQAGYDAWSPVVYAIDAVSRSFSEDERELVRRFLTEVTEVVTTSAGGAPAP